MKKLISKARNLLAFVGLVLLGANVAQAQETITVKWFDSSSNTFSAAGVASVSDVLAISDAEATGVAFGESKATYAEKSWATITSENTHDNKKTISLKTYVTFKVTVNSGYQFTPTEATAYALGGGTGENAAKLYEGTTNTATSAGITKASDAKGTEEPTKVTPANKTYEAGESFFVTLYFGFYTDKKTNYAFDVVITGTYNKVEVKNWGKPSFTLGEYDGSNYSVTISSEEGTTLKYKVGDAAEYTTSASNSQIVYAAPNTTIKAIATGGGLDDSNEVSYTVPAAPAVEAPTITAGSYDYVKGGWPITITSATENATVSYKVGSSEYADVENGATVYVQGGELKVKASKTGYSESAETTIGTLNAAPSSTSPETLIAVFRNKDDYDKSKDHDYVSVSVNGDYIAGTYNNSDGMKFRATRNHASVATIDGYAFSLTVKDGYKVTGVKITAASNRAGEIKVSNMYVDGVAFEGFEEFTMPDTKATVEKNCSGLNATKEIAWKLEPGTYDSNSTVDQFNAKIEVTYAPTTETKEVTEYGWATYIPAYAAKFNEGDAYVITDVNDEVVIIENVTEVPANTAVLLKGEGEKTITFVESATKPAKNLLEVYSEDKSDKVAYVLAKDEVNGAGFKKWAGEADLTGRAVLWLDNETVPARGFFALGGETTGIETVAPAATQDGAVYDLQGRRVAQPKSGLYILNGKKVVVK